MSDFWCFAPRVCLWRPDDFVAFLLVDVAAAVDGGAVERVAPHWCRDHPSLTVLVHFCRRTLNKLKSFFLSVESAPVPLSRSFTHSADNGAENLKKSKTVIEHDPSRDSDNSLNSSKSTGKSAEWVVHVESTRFSVSEKISLSLTLMPLFSPLFSLL